MEKKPVRLAIMGAGLIAQKMGKTIHSMNGIEAYAVASRSLMRAQALANAFHFEKAYGSYEEMLADEAVDLVYLATPHSLHAQQMLQCIEADKNVLCEKSFCINAAEARAVFASAKERGVLAAEAIWTRYMPMAQQITEFVQSGRLGRIHSVSSNLGYPVWEHERVRKHSLGGGALLDIGIYNLHFADMILGDDIMQIDVSARIDETEKTDACESVLLTYRSGATALLFNSIIGTTDRNAAIYGENGYAIIDNVNNFQSLRVYNDSYEMVEEILAPPQITGFEYEVAACLEAMENGWTEPALVPHATTMRVMQMMDMVRNTMGLRYPGDD